MQPEIFGEIRKSNYQSITIFIHKQINNFTSVLSVSPFLIM